VRADWLTLHNIITTMVVMCYGYLHKLGKRIAIVMFFVLLLKLLMVFTFQEKVCLIELVHFSSQVSFQIGN